MTPDEEDRRLALSTAIAACNSAHDAISQLDLDPTCNGRVYDKSGAARYALRELLFAMFQEQSALKEKAIRETPKEDR